MNILITNDKSSKAVGLIPSDVNELVKNGVKVYFTSMVGSESGYKNSMYLDAGAKLVKVDKNNFKQFDLIVSYHPLKALKFYKWANPNQLFWCNGYLVNNTKVLFHMIKNSATVLSTDAINQNGIYEYLLPYEQIKGNFAPVAAIYHLSKLNSFSTGNFYGKVDELNSSTNFIIINYSYAGIYAAKTILGLGANVIYLDSSIESHQLIKTDPAFNTLIDQFHGKLTIDTASYENICKYAKEVHVLINTTQIPTLKTEMRINKDILSLLPKGAIFIDLAAESGLSSDMSMKVNKITNTNLPNRVTQFVFNNIPELFPRSISQIFSKLNTKYFINIAKETDVHTAIRNNQVLKDAMITYRSKIINHDIASSLHLEYTDLNQIK